MKSIIAAAVAILAFAITMCSANAAEQTYKDSTGEVFSLYNVYKVEPSNGGTLILTYVNGLTNLYYDAGGVVLARIMQNNQQLVPISGALGYIDPGYFVRIKCINGKSTLSAYGSGLVIEYQDACTFANLAAAKAK